VDQVEVKQEFGKQLRAHHRSSDDAARHRSLLFTLRGSSLCDREHLDPKLSAGLGLRQSSETGTDDIAILG
jgi:hypothetical protein